MRIRPDETTDFLSRRELIRTGCGGLGSIALSSLLAPAAFGAAPKQRGEPLLPRPHHTPQAKNVIALHMVGAPSQLDLFDDKPVLRAHHGELVPERLISGERFAFLRGHPRLLGSEFAFSRHGESGLELSQLLPHLGTVADEIAVVKTLHSEQFNHAPAQLFFQTGFERYGRPSLGSWVSYGLGTENRDLPAFVVLTTGATAGAGNSLWGSAFLPTVHQGIKLRSKGDPVLFLSDPPGLARDDRRRVLDSIEALNRERLGEVGDPEIATRIAQYELAFRMQTAVPDLMDLEREPASVREEYGATPGKSSLANHCLLARRLVERGVRFVQIYDSGWDHHGSVFANMRRKCREMDRPVAALIRDLRQRGLIDETLVIWGAEFGRTPMVQGNLDARAGRDHHRHAFCAWLAGAGVRGGATVGRTDDLGYHIVEAPQSLNDLHATILHLLGVDHERLTFRFQGRDFRLTDVAGEVIDGVLASGTRRGIGA